MAIEIQMVQGDTRPFVDLQLYDDSTDPPTGLDVSNPSDSVRMYVRSKGNPDAAVLTIVGLKVPGFEDPDTGLIDETAPYDVDGAGGRLSFPWPAGSTNQFVGKYEAEFEITFADGTKQTIYDKQIFRFRAQVA